METNVFITSNYCQIFVHNYRMNFFVSSIAEVSLNKITLSIVHVQMIGQADERLLLVMSLKIWTL